jgi:hypothetical protein
MADGMPPWLIPASPADYAARGLGIGANIASARAAQAFRAAEQEREAQREAVRQAEWQQEMALAQEERKEKAQAAAERLSAMRSYQLALSSGMDPLAAMLQYGPAMGQQGSPEAAALRSLHMQPKAPTRPPVTWRTEWRLDPERNEAVPWEVSSTGQSRLRQDYLLKLRNEQVQARTAAAREAARQRQEFALLRQQMAQLDKDYAQFQGLKPKAGSPTAERMQQNRDQYEKLKAKIDDLLGEQAEAPFTIKSIRQVEAPTGPPEEEPLPLE